MKKEIEKIINEVFKETPEWAHYESHSFENDLIDEGEYVKVEDMLKALNEVADRVAKLNKIYVR
jgi:hypothetical protein